MLPRAVSPSLCAVVTSSASSSPTFPARARRLVLLGFVALSPLAMATHEPRSRHAIATGRIEGQVLLSTTLTAKRPRFRIYSDPGPGSRPPARDADEMRNVVVYVQRVSGEEPSATRMTMSQRDEQFLPRVLPVTRGATVDFPNGDDVYHNVFSLSSAKTFDLGRYPRGASKRVTFDKAGPVQVFCHIHSDMSAVVLVLENPYYAIPVENGRYVIENVPAGEYTVVGWHERIKSVTHSVRVVAGETVKQDFNIPIPLPAEDGR